MNRWVTDDAGVVLLRQKASAIGVFIGRAGAPSSAFMLHDSLPCGALATVQLRPNRHGSIKLRIASLIHLAHAARAEGIRVFVWTQPRAWIEHDQLSKL